ncbi:uncharacterized protein LOC111629501 [Centruroides sculpturatus]|uniref:uncharacterized protein LOC111612478 n=1 Tax=Centruroides sculpturatus TaxID=218467 RepID=UPI000C6E46EF|nr:uncharacterized protein LOC111612478 [Centruroides sculpturatus]XP_023229187.1 uncharacterized protein LOC111629501 [Centruroides sculpturatus]
MSGERKSFLRRIFGGRPTSNKIGVEREEQRDEEMGHGPTENPEVSGIPIEILVLPRRLEDPESSGFQPDPEFLLERSEQARRIEWVEPKLYWSPCKIYRLRLAHMSDEEIEAEMWAEGIEFDRNKRHSDHFMRGALSKLVKVIRNVREFSCSCFDGCKKIKVHPLMNDELRLRNRLFGPLLTNVESIELEEF